MSKAGGIFKFGYGVLNDLGMFSPTEKAIDLLGQDKFPARDLLRLEEGQTKGLLSKFGKGVSDEMVFTGLEDKILGLPDSGSITSKELKDYLAGNKTRVEEIIKSDKTASDAGQMAVENFQNFVPTTIYDIRRNIDGVEGEIAGSQQTEGFINNLSSGDDYSVRLFDDIANDDNRKGTIDNPFIQKASFDEFSDIFQSRIRDRYDKIAEKSDQEVLDNNNYANKEELAKGMFDVNTRNLIKFRFIDDSLLGDENAYTIRGNDNIGFQIMRGENLAKDAIDNDELIGEADSFNEALLQLNGFRRQKIESSADDIRDLRPMHSSYTLPGGENYQEILLKMETPIDNVEANLGNVDEVLQEDRFGGIISLNPITGSTSDVTLDKGTVKNLKAGNKVTIDTNRGQRVLRVNKDTNKVELLKKDYTNEIHTGDEENVVVFTRTKDRVDEDGRKILYAEEIQSDMSQQGRSKGLVMGEKEKKSFINKNNPVIYGDLLDSIEKLKKTTNIGELKGLKGSSIEPRRRPISKTVVGFDNDTDVIANIGSSSVINRLNWDKAHSLEDIIKKFQTKYKFITTKDKNVNIFSNSGIDKSNVNLLDESIIEEQGINIPKGIYDDISDYVDLSLVREKTNAFEKDAFSKIYDREYDKQFGVRNAYEFQKGELPDLNNIMLQKGLSKQDYKQFMKNARDEVLSEDSFTSVNREEYEALNDADIIDIPSGIVIDDKELTKVSKADYEKEFIQMRIDKIIADKLQQLTAIRDYKALKAQNFDYSDNAIDEVHEGLKELNSNLIKAIQYNNKLQPISDIPSAPFIGTSERFTELAIKRLMKYANDNGYDGVSFSSGLIHDKRWRQPELKQYYDVVIPKVAKNLLKGTDAKLEYKTILSDMDFLETAERGELALDIDKYDINNQLRKGENTTQIGGFIKDTPTIYLTPQVKEYINSGTSLYTPIVATGLAGATANRLMGSEEDIITEDNGI